MPERLKRVTKSSFLDLVSEFLATAKQALQSDGYLVYVIAWVTEDGSIYVTDSYDQALKAVEELHQQGRSEEAVELKRQMFASIREQLRQHGAIGCLTVSEAWVTSKQMPKGSIAYGEQRGQVLFPGMRELPRFDVRRREAILVYWEWKGPPANVHEAGRVEQFYRREKTRIVMEEIERSAVDLLGGLSEGLLRGT